MKLSTDKLAPVQYHLYGFNREAMMLERVITLLMALVIAPK